LGKLRDVVDIWNGNTHRPRFSPRSKTLVN
jgi:hypothetical protein